MATRLQVRVAAWIGAAALAATALAKPQVFEDLTVEDAIAASRERGRIVLVDAMATWCAPCLRMDNTTWRDEDVEEWVSKAGLAVQFDVDQHGETAQRLKITALPTIIAFKDGAEFDRVVGYRTAEQMSAWIEGMMLGKKGEGADGQADAVAGFGEMPKLTPEETALLGRMDAAKQLLTGGKRDEALAIYKELWSEIPETAPKLLPVRGSLLAMDITVLAASDAPTREHFAAVRDALEPRVQTGRASPQELDDWVVLNSVLDDEERTLAWFDNVKEDPRRARAVDSVANRLRSLLQEHARFGDLAPLLPNPPAFLDQQRDIRRVASAQESRGNPEMAEEAGRRDEVAFRELAGTMYAGLLAANRDQDGAKVAARARKHDPSGAMIVALVRAALQAGEPRRAHLDWARKAGEMGEAVEGLEREVQDALAAGKGGAPK